MQKLHEKIERIDVYIWNKFVGAAALDPKLGYYVFAYDHNFAKSGIELSPLHMPLRSANLPFVFTDLPELTYKRLPAMLADALPDDFGNALIDSYMASKGISSSNISILDRLAYMGNRSMGALEFKPSHGPKKQIPTAIELSNLVVEARNVINSKLSQENEISSTLRDIIEVGTSAGGARAKAVIAWNSHTDEIRSGQTNIPIGFEHWLLKFDGMGPDKELGNSQDYGRIEYAYYLMAVDCGINIQPSRLIHENGRAHFMTKRFDREPDNIKHHMQTLCAINHLDYKKKSTNSYEQLFITMEQLELERSDIVEAFRRMAFNIIARNCDDHTKNISFILKQGTSWKLSPAYDLTFAYNPNGEWTNQHLMSINQKFKDFTYTDLLSIADRFAIGEAHDIIWQVQNSVRQWKSYATKTGVDKAIIRHIQQEHCFLI